MHRADELFAHAFEHAPLGMAIVDLEGNFIRVNPSLCKLLRYPEQTLLESTVMKLTHPDDRENDSDLLHGESSGELTTYSTEKRYIRSDGEVIECVLSVAVINDESGAPLHTICQVQDVTKQRRLERQLQQLADRDYLTGLLNRRRFEHELERQIERCSRHGERAALLLLDIDHFKAVNDTGGHAAGDRLLRLVGEIFEERIRRSDLTARIGGDEFAAILVDADVDAAVKVAEDLAGSLRAHDGVDATASVGIALLRPNDGVDAALARADRAMYAVKRAGRNGVLSETR
jgi:diguanylate cyclase (GGDEF)-like protein/PAS domain S-box-containing protein